MSANQRTEVELLAVVDDAEGRPGKLLLLQAVQKLLEQRRRAVFHDDEIFREVALGEERVGRLGRTGGFGFF